MQTFTLVLNMPLLTLNKAFSTLRNGSRVKSQDYKAFSKTISRIMSFRRSEFKAFDSFYDYKKHEIHAELIYYTPDLYTKDGRISKTSGDVPNMEKCLTDSIFEKTNINDACITDWHLLKRYHPSFKFSLTLTIVERSNLAC